VLEDDAVVCEDFPRRVEALLAEAGTAWDWIYLFYHPDCKRDLPIPGKTLVQRGFETWGTVAYALSHAGATALLAAATDTTHDAPIDHLVMRLAREGTIRTLCATRMLVTTAGQLNPLAPAAALGSNVWGTPTLLDLAANTSD